MDVRVAQASSLVTRLRCPYCGSALEQVLSIPEREVAADSLVYGLLRCECAVYPVLEGIPVLQHAEGLQRVVQLLRARDTLGALLQAMNVFRIKWAHRTRLHQAKYYMNCRRLANGSQLTFEDALQLVRKPRVFADYLLHRYANPSFLAAVTLMPILDQFLKGVRIGSSANGARPRVLDLGCGAGHSSFLLTVLFPHMAVTASDQDFVSLYLAKRFLAPNAEYVCSDVEVPSPFADSYFDAVHCLDAFHYFRSKVAIVGELRRVLKPWALWLFPHLHNALQENVTAGTPLSPEHYARCFEFLNPTVFDEADLLRHTGEIRRAPRSRGAAVAHLRGAQTVALVGGGKDSLDAAPPLLELLRDSGAGLRINPIYHGQWHGNTLDLEPRWPNEQLHEECRAVERVLPAKCALTRSQVRQLQGSGAAGDDPQVRELMSRFVLVPLPRNYSRHDFTAADSSLTS